MQQINLGEQQETILKEYFELLRFPTVGAEPTRLKDCVDCAMWLKKWLAPQGFAVELMQAPKMLGTPPVLLAGSFLRTLRRAACRSAGGVEHAAF